MNNIHTRLSKKLEKYRRQLPPSDKDWPSDVRRAVAYIRKHLFDPRLTVNKMKLQCHLNSKNFSGKFKYYVGERPKHFWLSHRIAIAKKVLADHQFREVTLIELAISTGFNHASSFTKAFKSREGITPGKYRIRQKLERKAAKRD